MSGRLGWILIPLNCTFLAFDLPLRGWTHQVPHYMINLCESLFLMLGWWILYETNVQYKIIVTVIWAVLALTGLYFLVSNIAHIDCIS